MDFLDNIKTRLAERFLNKLSEERIAIEYGKRMRRNGLEEDGKASANIIPTFTPQRVITLRDWQRAVDSANHVELHDRRELYDLYDRVLIDLDISRVMQNQVEQLQKAKYRLIDPNGEEDSEAIKMLETLWHWDYVKYVLEADGFGHSLIEMYDQKRMASSFSTNAGKKQVFELAEVNLIPRKHVKPEYGLWLVEDADTEGYSFRAQEMKPYYIEAHGSLPLGYLYKVAPMEISKRYALGTWSEFNEKIAFPFRWVNMPSGNKKRQQKIASILRNMGSAGWGIFHQGEEMKLLEMNKTDPHKCFLELISYVDRRVEAFIEGEGLNNETGKGSYASDKVRTEIKGERYKTNKIYLEYFSNAELLPRLVNFGYPLKGYRLECDERRDIPVEEQIKIDTVLLQHYKITPQFIAKRYGIPEEEIIERMAGATPDLGAQNLADFLNERRKK